MQRLIDEIRVYRRRAVTDEAREVMRVARHAGLHDHIGVAAQSLLDEVMVYRTRRKQRMNRQPALFEITIAEHDDELAAPDGGFGLLADPLERVRERHRVIHIEVNEGVILTIHGGPEQLPELLLRQHGRIHDHLLSMFGSDVEQAGFAADICLQRHHDALAQRIDRWIGNLRKLLPEIVEG